MTGVALAGAAVAAAGSIYGGYQAKKQANQAAKAAEAQAEATASYETAQAGNEQLKGEEEAAKRSRQLAQEIGSSYANWAGNGLSVSGKGDTFENILNTQVQEGYADINTIRDNTAVNVWQHQVKASNALAQGKNQARALKAQGKSAFVSSIFDATGGLLSGVADASKVYHSSDGNGGQLGWGW